MSTSVSQKQALGGLSLRANFSWTFVGNVLYSVTQWGLLTLLTKFFEPELFGRYSLAFSIVTPLFVASAMQLRAVYVSDVSQEDQPQHEEATFASYLVLRLTTTALALLLVMLLVAVGVIPWHLFGLSVLLGCNQALVLVKDIYQGVMQKHDRMDILSISKVLQGLASLVGAIGMVLLTRSILMVVLGMLVARFLVLLLYHVPQARAVHATAQCAANEHAAPVPLVTPASLRQALNVSQLWSLARTALPLCVVMLLINLHLHVPRYFLADLGEAEVGYFSAVASLAAMPELVITALGHSAVRQLALRYAKDKRAYLALVGQLVAIGAALGLAGVLGAVALGRPVLGLLFRPEYAAFTDVLIWLMVARAVMNVQSFLGYSMTAARWFNAQMWTYGLMLVSLFVAAWFVIPLWGGLGAAWATLASACVTLIAMVGVAIVKYRNEAVK